MADGRVYRAMVAVLFDFEMDYDQHGKEWTKAALAAMTALGRCEDIYFNDVERHKLAIKLTYRVNSLLKDLANSYSRSGGAKKAAATMKKRRESEAKIEELPEGRR